VIGLANTMISTDYAPKSPRSLIGIARCLRYNRESFTPIFKIDFGYLVKLGGKGALVMLHVMFPDEIIHLKFQNNNILSKIMTFIIVICKEKHMKPWK